MNTTLRELKNIDDPLAQEFEADGVLGSYVYMPDVLGYGPTLLIIGGVMVAWYVIVTWNEETNKLIVPM